MPAIDMTGKTFNHWTVIERAQNNSRGDAMWLCECDCEEHTRQIVKGSALRSGHSQSCGCLKRQKAAEIGKNNSKDLTGQKFNHLLVLERAYSKNSKTYWKCQCDCENQTIVYVATDKLTSGHTQSCGCLRIRNLTNQYFGRLIAIQPTDLRGADGSIIWECECQCSSKNKVYASTSELNQYKKVSCGCLNPQSRGESVIIALLEQNHIPFEREKIFIDCKFEDTNAFARFDFFVDNKYIIEFDGEQHFSYRDNSFFNKENFEKIQKHDEYKNNWCKTHNIPLIRIPYYILDELTCQDLLLSSSQYVVI